MPVAIADSAGDWGHHNDSEGEDFSSIRVASSSYFKAPNDEDHVHREGDWNDDGAEGVRSGFDEPRFCREEGGEEGQGPSRGSDVDGKADFITGHSERDDMRMNKGHGDEESGGESEQDQGVDEDEEGKDSVEESEGENDESELERGEEGRGESKNEGMENSWEGEEEVEMESENSGDDIRDEGVEDATGGKEDMGDDEHHVGSPFFRESSGRNGGLKSVEVDTRRLGTRETGSETEPASREMASGLEGEGSEGEGQAGITSGIESILKQGSNLESNGEGEETGEVGMMQGKVRHKELQQQLKKFSDKANEAFHSLTNRFIEANTSLQQIQSDQENMLSEEKTTSNILMEQRVRVKEAAARLQTDLLEALEFSSPENIGIRGRQSTFIDGSDNSSQRGGSFSSDEATRGKGRVTDGGPRVDGNGFCPSQEHKMGQFFNGANRQSPTGSTLGCPTYVKGRVVPQGIKVRKTGEIEGEGVKGSAVGRVDLSRPINNQGSLSWEQSKHPEVARAGTTGRTGITGGGVERNMKMRSKEMTKLGLWNRGENKSLENELAISKHLTDVHSSHSSGISEAERVNDVILEGEDEEKECSGVEGQDVESRPGASKRRRMRCRPRARVCSVGAEHMGMDTVSEHGSPRQALPSTEHGEDRIYLDDDVPNQSTLRKDVDGNFVEDWH